MSITGKGRSLVGAESRMTEGIWRAVLLSFLHVTDVKVEGSRHFVGEKCATAAILGTFP